MENLSSVTYGAPIKKYAQTTPSVISFLIFIIYLFYLHIYIFIQQQAIAQMISIKINLHLNYHSFFLKQKGTKKKAIAETKNSYKKYIFHDKKLQK
jgi:hypothetical protein